MVRLSAALLCAGLVASSPVVHEEERPIKDIIDGIVSKDHEDSSLQRRQLYGALPLYLLIETCLHIENVADGQRAAYTYGITQELAFSYTRYNNIVFKGLDSPRNLTYETFYEHKFDQYGAGKTNYGHVTFYDGKFERRGDGGEINVAYMGNYKRVKAYTGDDEDRLIIFEGRVPLEEFETSEDPGIHEHDTHKDDDDNKKRSASLPAWGTPVNQGKSVFNPAWASDSNVAIPSDGTRSSRTGQLAKRDGATPATDGTALVICKTPESQGVDDVQSGIAYYRDFAPGKVNGRQPDQFMWTAKEHNEHFRLSEGAARFSEGQALHWQIEGSAMDKGTPAGSYAGLADDGEEKFFLWKGDGEELFRTDEYACYTDFYAY